MGRESGKMSGFPPAFPQGLTPKPGDHPDHIHRRGCQEVLEVRASQADIATLAELEPAYPLREAALHAGPERILRFELSGLLALAGGLDGLVVGLGPDGQLPWGIFGRGTRTAGGTYATGGPVKADTNDRIARDIGTWRPFDTGMPLGTVGLLRFPIHHKGLQVIALPGLMLPTIGPKRRPDHIDLVLVLRRDQEVGIHIAAVEQVGPR